MSNDSWTAESGITKTDNLNIYNEIKGYARFLSVLWQYVTIQLKQIEN